MTYGGYSGSNVLHEHFIMKIPDSVPLDQAGPILCAGVTMYDPMRYFGATTKKDMKIGIVGIGGLGSMGVKLAKALGHQVVAISGSEQEELAYEKGADHFVNNRDPADMAKNAMSLDLILNTIPAKHEVADYVALLGYSGQHHVLTDDCSRRTGVDGQLKLFPSPRR